MKIMTLVQHTLYSAGVKSALVIVLAEVKLPCEVIRKSCSVGNKIMSGLLILMCLILTTNILT